MSADYRRFLGRREERVLVHLGGELVVAQDRALRLAAPLSAGFWRFVVEGRKATAIERVDPDERVLGPLPAVVGHWTGSRLVHGAASVEAVHLLPDEELARFAPCRARRWWSDDLVFESLTFETELEEEVRRAFEEERALGEGRGMPATLRAAFALAVVAQVSAATGVPAAPLEVRPALGAIAAGGTVAAREELERLRRERLAEARRQLEREERTRRTRAATERRHRAGSPEPRPGDLEGRVSAVLQASGARLRALRQLGGGLLEVTWEFLGERLRAHVEAEGLRVVNAGICLAGHDREVTLDSLPGVVREAVDTGQLVVTSHV